MDNFAGRTAVITGAASGMGLAFAHRFAREGMNVVLSDIEGPRLDEAVSEVVTHGTEVVAAVARDNLWACQFHPEKSGAAGLQVLANFVERLRLR